jgi:hypothetical protein
MNRRERIHKQLEYLERHGTVRSYYSSSPDGRRRWHIETALGSRSFSTLEVEAFIYGADAGRTEEQWGKVTN